MKKASGVRERIVDNSCRLFYEQGYLATGINQIIEEADIAKSSLYQHFKSKEDLLIEYLLVSNKEWFEGLYKLVGDEQDPKKNMLTLFDYRKQSAIKKQYKGCAFVRLAYELPNLEERAAELIRQYKSAVKSFISKQLSLIPQINADRQKELTEMIYTLYEGCGIESSLLKSTAPIERTRKIVSNLIA